MSCQILSQGKVSACGEELCHLCCDRSKAPSPQSKTAEACGVQLGSSHSFTRLTAPVDFLCALNRARKCENIHAIFAWWASWGLVPLGGALNFGGHAVAAGILRSKCCNKVVRWSSHILMGGEMLRGGELLYDAPKRKHGAIFRKASSPKSGV